MRKFILGTDWWTDCDDAVALRLLTRAVKEKKIKLLGIALNACMEYSVASLKGFLKADGITEEIPVGIDRAATDFGGKPSYQKRLATNHAPSLTNENAEDALKLYRRLLSESKEKLELMEIGYLQVISSLLKSGPDEICEKSGLELVREKVSKIWVMAGKWDAEGEKENNFCRNERSRIAAKEFCELCPVPVTFLGWEVGFGVISGGKLSKSDHLYDVLCDYGSVNGRHSWDPMLVMMALIGNEKEAGYGKVTGHARVDEKSGANYFEKDADGKHSFVVKLHPNSYYEEQINQSL